jgi:NurA domain
LVLPALQESGHAMLFKNSLSAQLQERREEFVSFDRILRADLSGCAERLARLGSEEFAQLSSRARAANAPGALPSTELEEARSTVIAFERSWRSHEEARRWALDVLFDRVTAAADGSQYLPGRDITLPIAAVQVALFENPHTREGTYVKEAELKLITPAEIMRATTDLDSLVALRRFREETRVLKAFLKRQEGWRERGMRMPLGFFDGTLLISYARPRNPIQDEYVEAIVELVELSRETGVPVVGYIDSSYARDLVNLLEVLGEWRSSYSVYDAQVLSTVFDGAALLKAWGDRTSFFYCDRKGLGDDFLDEQGDPLVGFTYLQTTADGMAARLDIPSWVFEAGLLEETIDTVRAECVVGNGYPYALETADAAAVIGAQDRGRLLQALQAFAEQEKLSLRVSRKAMSKSRRR